MFTYASYHDVVKMADADALAACTTTGNAVLADNTQSPYSYTVTAADQTAGAAYFSCSYWPVGNYSHCRAPIGVYPGNMKLTVTVNPAFSTRSPTAPTAAPTTTAAPAAAPTTGSSAATTKSVVAVTLASIFGGLFFF